MSRTLSPSVTKSLRLLSPHGPHCRFRTLPTLLSGLWLILLHGCATATEPGEALVLSNEVRESSGLWCDATGETLYTLNDSGNQPLLYQLSSDGEIVRRIAIDAHNHDWEALAGDSQRLYIADTGNNSGKRRQLMIHSLSHQQLQSAESLSAATDTGATPQTIKLQPHTITIRYADLPDQALNPWAHDFDAEALVARQDDLLLLSKSRNSDWTRVYRIDKQQPEQLLSPVARIHTPGWLVTGATLDSRDSSLLLIGYQKQGFPFFRARLARVSADLSQIETVEPGEGGQVEAICSLADGRVLYTQEGNLLSQPTLFSLPGEALPTVD